MAKTILKEVIIFLLLLIVIALVLGVLFYDYIPNNKIVPTALKPYELSEEVQEELNETMSRSSENIVKTYYIDSSDLSVYASTKDYNKGKVNPFEDYTSQQTTNSTVTNNNKNTTSASNSTENQTSNTVNRNEDFTGGKGGKTE
ncbi:MAG: hypothetical protein ACI4UX_01790 [Clostridia bacterium]